MRILPIILCIFVCLIFGCKDNKIANDSEIIAEGSIWYVEYENGEGEAAGFTRSSHATVIPNGGGGINVDAYGKLTPQFLIIEYPKQRDLGKKIIPTKRLLSIQFGKGGIDTLPEK